MKKIGIICAGDSELEPFLKRLNQTAIMEKAMLNFHEGTIDGLPVTVLYSGVCKVNAAAAAQLLIDAYVPDMVINAGTAGGIANQVRLFDTIVAEAAVYHDVADDILTEFHPWLKENRLLSDSRLLTAAKAYSCVSPHPLLFGDIATGEQFVAESERERIRRQLSPLAADMETAAIAHVCYVNQIPFLSVRTITDTAAHDGIDSFEQNCAKASEIAADVTMGILKQAVCCWK